jgi:hypothetical protein
LREKIFSRRENIVFFGEFSKLEKTTYFQYFHDIFIFLRENENFENMLKISVKIFSIFNPYIFREYL